MPAPCGRRARMAAADSLAQGAVHAGPEAEEDLEI